MALKKDFPVTLGDFIAVVPDSYIKILGISGNKKKITMLVGIFKSENSANEIKAIDIEFTPSVDENSKNFIYQGYEYMKTLPEFIDAVDC